MAAITPATFWSNFLGNAPGWYKRTIVFFLIINPLLLLSPAGSFVVGWLLVLEFIFTLAMALRCYPLQPGGLLALEAVAIGLTSPDTVRTEVVSNVPVLLLLIFMVAGIYFMRELLLFLFSKILLGIRSKMALALLIASVAALLSAFLDALTVMAVLISVTTGFYAVFHKVASGFHFDHADHDHTRDTSIVELHREDLEAFRAFLRSLLMHGAVGTAIGGVTTMVGEPQNLLIASQMEWNFVEFFLKMAPVTLPVVLAGFATCVLLERTGAFGYATVVPDRVRSVLLEYEAAEAARRTPEDKLRLVVQAIAAAFLVIGLGFHLAEVGFIGLAIIVLQTAFNGIIQEHRIGHAFEESLPFTALLVVFFAIVAVIHDQHLFTPVVDWVLHLDREMQPSMFYVANGVLSAISDNVFVATIYITEVKSAYLGGLFEREHLDHLAIAINTGTNIPSVATPNGQAAFLFLLTSSIAPLIRLSYVRMVVMAVPYTLVMSVVGYACVLFFL
jgi:NhaB family Na+:H+ antiporter